MHLFKILKIFFKWLKEYSGISAKHLKIEIKKSKNLQSNVVEKVL